MHAGTQLPDVFQRGRRRVELESCLALAFAPRQIHLSLLLSEGVDLMSWREKVPKIRRVLSLSLSLRGKALCYIH